MESAIAAGMSPAGIWLANTIRAPTNVLKVDKPVTKPRLVMELLRRPQACQSAASGSLAKKLWIPLSFRLMERSSYNIEQKIIVVKPLSRPT